MNPRVTVLMTVYNGLPFLREAIESVLGQGFRDFEFLIVDDASTDQSVETIQSYSDERIRLIKNSVNLGQNGSLNKGLAEAQGEFVVRLDQDDMCLPGRIETQVAFLASNPEISAAGTWAYSMDEHSRKTGVWKWNVSDFGKLVGLLLLGRCALLHPSAAYRRQTILDLGGYDNTFGLASDYALWIDLVLAHRRVAVIPAQLIMYRSHGKRQSALKSHLHWTHTAQAHEKLVRALSDHPDIATLASVLRIESTIWNQHLKQGEIASILSSIEDVLNGSAAVLSLRPDEWTSMRRTVYRWLGPGVRLGAKAKHLPPAIFYPAVFAFSPLLIPGVRPLVTRILQYLRQLRTLPERSIN